VPAFVGKPLDREHLAWEHEGSRAIRAGNWKLVATANAAWELYDVDADPAELSDIAARHADLSKELAAKWDSWAKRCNVLTYPLLKKK
jgi:arylsulfatase